MKELEIKDCINGYMNGIGWNKDEINIVEYRNRIFDMYLKQYNHYKELHHSLNNFDFVKRIECLNSLRELKTDEVNNIISWLFKAK